MNKDATTTDSIQEVQSQALTLLERPLFYGPILDAIDDDHAGYVSIRKLNLFISNKPKHWSLLRWLTFSAAGWERINIRYMKLIAELFLTRLGDAVESGPNGPFVKEYLKVVKPEILAISSSSHADNAHPADLEDYLAELEKEIDDIQKDHIAVKLKALKYQVTSPELVSGVVPSPRLEESILCLVTLLLQNHIETLENEKKISRAQYLVMVASFSTICEAFTSRFEYLKASWISDAKLDMAVQIHRYAGGLFEGVWMATMAPTEQISDNPKERSPENDKSDLVPTTKNLHPGHQLGHKSISDPQPTGPNQQDHVREQSLPLIHSALHDQSRVTIERAGIAGDHQSRGTISKLAQSAGEQQDRPRERPSLPSPALHGQSEVIYGHHHLLGPPSRSLLGTGSKTSLARPLPKPPGSGAAISHSVQAPVALTPNHQIGPDQYQSPVQPAYRDDTDTSSKRNRLVSNFHHVYIASHSSLGRIDPEQRQDVSPPLSYPYVSSETGSQRGLRHPVDSQETVLRHLPKNDSKDEGLGMALKKIWKKFKGRDSDTYHTSAQCSSPVGGTGAQTPRHNLSSSSPSGLTATTSKAPKVSTIASSTYTKTAKAMEARAMDASNQLLGMPKKARGTAGPLPGGSARRHRLEEVQNKKASKGEILHSDRNRPRTGGPEVQLRNIGRKADRSTAGSMELCTPAKATRQQPFSSHLMSQTSSLKAGPEHAVPSSSRPRPANSQNTRPAKSLLASSPSFSHPSRAKEGVSRATEKPLPAAPHPSRFNTVERAPLSSSPHHASVKGVKSRVDAPLAASRNHLSPKGKGTLPHRGNGMQPRSGPSSLYTDMMEAHSGGRGHGGVKAGTREIGHAHPYEGGSEVRRGEAWKYPHGNHVDGRAYGHQQGYSDNVVRNGENGDGNYDPAGYKYFSNVQQRNHMEGVYDTDGNELRSDMDDESDMLEGSSDSDDEEEEAEAEEEADTDEEDDGGDSSDDDGSGSRPDLDEEELGASDSDEEGDSWRNPRFADRVQEEDVDDVDEDEDEDEEASDSDEEGRNWSTPRFGDGFQEANVEDIDEDEEEASDTDEEDEGGDNSDGNEVSDGDDEEDNWSPRFEDRLEEDDVDDTDDDEEEVPDSDEEDEDDYEGEESAEGDDDEGGSANNWNGGQEGQERSYRSVEASDSDEEAERYSDDDGAASFDGGQQYAGEAYQYSGDGRETSFDNGGYYSTGYQQDAGEAYGYSGDGPETSFDDGGYSYGDQQDAGEDYGYSDDDRATSFDDGGSSSGDQQYAEDGSYSDDDVDDNYSYPTRY
ncbi:hypothetical protein D9615_008222 [Tricholomella constricta]|uniref:Uncharacterized protein n=1 Tax=Tricholomella constricta TaxID=117010 RepID=A0A8H5H375_9AGAR|nr:hypothetical protein D9615_008222 [Tricholomella constricta]